VSWRVSCHFLDYVRMTPMSVVCSLPCVNLIVQQLLVRCDDAVIGVNATLTASCDVITIVSMSTTLIMFMMYWLNVHVWGQGFYFSSQLPEVTFRAETEPGLR